MKEEEVMGDWWNPWAWINRQAEEAERLRQEEDERKRQEEERLRQEEEERKRQEEERLRQEEEERKRQEEERLRQEEAERQRLAPEEQKRQDDLAAQGQDLAHEMGIGATLAGSMSGFRQLEEKMAKAEESSGADFRLLDEQSQREQEAEEKRKQEEERTKAQEYLFAINVFGSVEDFKKSVIGRADEAVEWAKTKGEEVAQKIKEKELREALRRDDEARDREGQEAAKQEEAKRQELHQALMRDEEARDREGQEAAKQEEAKRQELNEALTRDEDARSREGKEREDEFAEWRDSEAVFQSPSSDESDVTPLTKEQEERRVELSVNTSRTEEETDELVALSNQSRKWDIYRYDQDKRQKENEKNNLAKVNSVKSTMPEEKMIAFAKTMPQGSTTNLEVAVGDILIEKYLRGQLDTYNDKKLEESVIHLLRRRVTVDQKGGNGMFSNEDGLATRDMLRRKFETSGGAGIDLKSIKTTENELYKLRTLLAVDTGNKATETNGREIKRLVREANEIVKSGANDKETLDKHYQKMDQIYSLQKKMEAEGRGKEAYDAILEANTDFSTLVSVAVPLAIGWKEKNPFSLLDIKNNLQTSQKINWEMKQFQGELVKDSSISNEVREKALENYYHSRVLLDQIIPYAIGLKTGKILRMDLEKIENKLARGLVEHVATNMLSDSAGNVKDFMISDEKIRSKALADAKMAIESRAKETRWYELDKNKVKPQGEKKWYQE